MWPPYFWRSRGTVLGFPDSPALKPTSCTSLALGLMDPVLFCRPLACSTLRSNPVGE